MLKILIVDDNFLNRKLLLEMLRDSATCDLAVNGKEAMEAYTLSLNEARPYDIILLDIAMPEIDGMQVLGMIRAQEQARGVAVGEGVPIIMVTAFKEHCLQAFNVGCDDYILKPYDKSVLLEKIGAVVSKRRV
jgi:two-component system chemotaxis response regulator CheY